MCVVSFTPGGRKKIKSYRNIMGDSEGKNQLGYLGVDGNIVRK
jgi:hypothetical protein